MNSIYNSHEAKVRIMALYSEKLTSLGRDYENIDIDSQFGRTRVVRMGNPQGPKAVLFHAFNAGAPLTLEALGKLCDKYNFYVIESLGQATHSEEIRMDIKGDALGRWADEVLEALQMNHSPVIGISYGAFIVQKLMQYNPQRISKCIFVVPSGIVNGELWPALTKLTLPLIRYKITKKDRDLQKFLDAFVPEEDFLRRLLKSMMEGVKLDTRIPPLLKKKQVNTMTAPVYLIVADDDVYFPGTKLIKRSERLFKNFSAYRVLKACKHMPAQQYHEEIQKSIDLWLQ